jgi:PAS domain S-box-containing protein
LIARRLWLFAFGWLTTIAAWMVVFVVLGRTTALVGTAFLVGHGLLLAAVGAVCRAYPVAPWLRAVVCGAGVLLGTSVVVACAAADAPGDILAFVLLTLYLMSALMFAWGWGAELVLLAGTMVSWALLAGDIEYLVAPAELITAVIVGAGLCLGVAEGAARTFALAFLRRGSAEEAARELAVSRDAYRDIAESARDYIWAADMEGVVTYVNPATIRFLGYALTEIVGRSAFEFLTDHPANRSFAGLVARVHAGETVPPLRLQCRTARGTRWVELMATAVHGPDGTPSGIRGISRDIEKRVRAEVLLRESQERFRVAFGEAPIGMAITGADGHVQQVNRAVCEMLGYDHATLLERGLLAVTHPDDVDASDRSRRDVAIDRLRSLEKRFVHADGHVVWARVDVSLVRDERGQILHGLAQIQDISDRKRAEDALRASESRYRSLVETQSEAIVRFDHEGRLTFANEYWTWTTGRSAEQTLGHRHFDLIHPDDRGAAENEFRAVQERGERVRHLNRIQTIDGYRWFEWEASVITDQRGQVVEFQGVGRDVDERCQAEEALRASEARYRGLVESQEELVVRLDPRGQFTFANEACEKKFGMTRAALFERETPLVHEGDVPAVVAALAAVQEPPYRGHVECRETTPAGWRWFEWDAVAILEHGAVVEIQAVGRDVTERRAAQEALHHSLGDLRRSQDQLRLLAQRQVKIREQERKRLGLDLHDDVCQELVGIGILVESLRRRLGPIPADSAREFERVGGYLGQLVDHLRLLARELQPLQLHDLGLEGSLRSLAQGLASECCSVVPLFPTSIPRLSEEAEVGVYRIAQEALTNAIRHAEAGRVRLMLAAMGDILRLEVSDDGCGFDPDDRSNALGLVSMEERALSLGGRLTIWSSPGGGTTVRLECPIGERASASAA